MNKTNATPQKIKFDGVFEAVAWVKFNNNIPSALIEVQKDLTAIVTIPNPNLIGDKTKADCKYFLHNPLLPCAVNTDCQDCRDYIVKE